MRLGISSYTYGWAVGVPGNPPGHPMTELDILNQALDHNLTTVQLGDNLPVHQFQVERIDALRDASVASSIRLEIGARGLRRNHLYRYLELCVRLHAPLLRFVTDEEGFEPSASEIIETILEVVPILRKNNIRLALENHDRLRAKELAHIMETIGEPEVGICLDCVNSLGAGEGFDYVLRTLAPYTINIHIKDFVIRRLPHKMGFTVTGTKAGCGMTDILALLETVQQFGRCESAILEQWVEPADDLEKTILKERSWASEGIAYLQALPQFKNTKTIM